MHDKNRNRGNSLTSRNIELIFFYIHVVHVQFCKKFNYNLLKKKKKEALKFMESLEFHVANPVRNKIL